MLSLDELKSKYSNNKIDYPLLFQNIKRSGSYDDESILDVFVPTYNRDKFAVKALLYLDRSLRHADIKYNLVCTSFNESPELEEQCNKLGAILVCCPLFPKQHGMFSRALSFDLPCRYLSPTAEWLMFTDCDLLVTEDFISETISNLASSNTWLQPYSGKRVSNLNQESTEIILGSDEFLDLEQQTVTYPKAGAPGGCVVVPKKLYDKVGGYDSELFWGYGPEDSMFWVKLESCFSTVDSIAACHVGNATYAKEATVYHCYHESQQGFTDNFIRMADIHNSFFALPYNQKLELINHKRELYED